MALVDPTTSKGKECYRYTAFGEREIYDETGTSLSKSTLHNPWGFASKRHDPETGFVYFSRRYFAPEIGRWVTPDPLGFADGPNLYAYVHNNPLTRFDLYGLWDVDDVETAHTNVMLYTAAEFGARFVVDLTALGWEAMHHSTAEFDWRDAPGKQPMPVGYHANQITEPFERTAESIRTPILEHANGVIGNNGPSAEATYRITETSLTIGSMITAGYQILKSGVTKLTSYAAKGSEKAVSTLASNAPKMSNLPGNQKSIHTSVTGKTTPDFFVGPNGTIVPTSRTVFESGLQKAGFETFKTESPGIGYIISEKLTVRVMEPAGELPLRASFTHKPRGGHINPFTNKPVQPPKGLTNEERRAYVSDRTHMELK